ncbi:hypothetical protein EAF04_000622 [Stromatinia cepivora]|nr:hypothetical protein EAF04_000622 [Stromatinia cepivora]
MVVNDACLQDTTPKAARNFQWKKKRKLFKPITHIGFFKCPCAYAEKAIQEMNSAEFDGRTICIDRRPGHKYIWKLLPHSTIHIPDIAAMEGHQ